MTPETQILNCLKYRNGATRDELRNLCGSFKADFTTFRLAIEHLKQVGFITHCQEKRYDLAKGGAYMWIGYRITEKGAEQ